MKKVIREYLAGRTTVRTPSAPFYGRTRIEKLGEKHPGLRGFVEDCQHRRVPYPKIAAFILKNWGEVVSEQVLSNFYRLRVWPKEWSEARDRKIEEMAEGASGGRANGRIR